MFVEQWGSGTKGKICSILINSGCSLVILFMPLFLEYNASVCATSGMQVDLMQMSLNII